MNPSIRTSFAEASALHVTPEEYERIKAAATAAGLTIKEFCRRAALNAAK